MEREDSRWIVGVDAGGSKTVAWLAQCAPGPNGKFRIQLHGSGTSGPANPTSLGVAGAAQSMLRAISAAIEEYLAAKDIGHSINFIPEVIWIGAAGAARSEVSQELCQVISRKFPSVDVHVSGDASLLIAAAQSFDPSREIPACILQSVSANRGATSQVRQLPLSFPSTNFVATLDRARPVVAIVAGTGSIVWAVDGSGAVNRWGGLGPTLGDIGSGTWLGQCAIRATLDELSHQGPPTRLRVLLSDYYRIADPRALLLFLSEANQTPFDLAQLAPIVIAASNHDVVAAEIVEQGIKGLADLARDAANLAPNFPSIFWALGGGILTSNPSLTDRLLSKLFEPAKNLIGQPPGMQVLVHKPVWGAVMSAAAEIRRPKLQ